MMQESKMILARRKLDNFVLQSQQRPTSRPAGILRIGSYEVSCAGL